MRNILIFCFLSSCLFLQAEPLFTHNVTGAPERFINGSEKKNCREVIPLDHPKPAAENLDKNSFGEILNTYVEDITDYK